MFRFMNTSLPGQLMAQSIIESKESEEWTLFRGDGDAVIVVYSPISGQIVTYGGFECFHIFKHIKGQPVSLDYIKFLGYVYSGRVNKYTKKNMKKIRYNHSRPVRKSKYFCDELAKYSNDDLKECLTVAVRSLKFPNYLKAAEQDFTRYLDDYIEE